VNRINVIKCLIFGSLLFSFLTNNIYAKEEVGKTPGTRSAQQQTPNTQKQSKYLKLVYNPPRRGAPRVRIGGGTRGKGEVLTAVYVLAPEHTGLTTASQPDLFWYISGGLTNARIEFTLIDDHSIEPLLEIPLKDIKGPAVRRIRLSRFGVKLSPGSEYQWSVALISDPQQRSLDIVATGRIERTNLPENVKSQLKRANQEEHAQIYAEAGFWYDSIKVVSDMVDARPDDAQWRNSRASLLEQVGLTEVAAFDRK
jgi:hypothetical protein